LVGIDILLAIDRDASLFLLGRMVVRIGGFGMTAQITALNSSRHCARSRVRPPSAISQSRWLSAMPRSRSAARLVSLSGSAAAACLAFS
jgi:hypothetical protein